MSMEEWIDFMMATDDDLDSHVAAKQEKDQVGGARLARNAPHPSDIPFRV
jgi:hypothetical protein